MAVKSQEELQAERQAAYPQRSWDRYNKQDQLQKNVIDTMFASGGGIPNWVIVTSAADLSGSLSSDALYVVTGDIDMGTTTITVPAGGLNITGSGIEVALLFSTEPNYTMFDGGGTLVIRDFSISVTGSGSQVYDLTGPTGNEAINIQSLNYVNCVSLGTISGYRQGTEDGTARFGGSPALKLDGTWLGGYVYTTSIVRGFDDTYTGSLFEAGPSFVMNSRFLTNANVDLGLLSSFLDFSPSNFPNPSTLQIRDAIITRDGISVPNDPNITPNITQEDLASNWKDNVGLNNTYEGGRLNVVVSAPTTNPGQGVFTDAVAGTWGSQNLVHFSSPTAGQLKHDGTSPREYRLFASLKIAGGINNEIGVQVVKFNGVSDEIIQVETAQVIFTLFSLDIAILVIDANIDLDEGQTARLQVANFSNGVADLTLLENSYFLIRER